MLLEEKIWAILTTDSVMMSGDGFARAGHSSCTDEGICFHPWTEEKSEHNETMRKEGMGGRKRENEGKWREK